MTRLNGMCVYVSDFLRSDVFFFFETGPIALIFYILPKTPFFYNYELW